MLTETLENSTTVTTGLLVILSSIVLIPLVKWLWISFRTPGPWGVPILGYYPFMRKDFHVQLHELTKKHGDAFLINIAGENFLHLGTLKALKEVHINKAEDFPSRGHKHSVLQYPLEDGLAFQEGDQWKLQRKFFVQSMRELGLTPNKAEMQGPVAEAVQSTLENLHKSKGEVINASSLMYKECTNVVLRLMLGDGISEEMVMKLNETYLKILAPMTGNNLVYIGTISKYFILPWIKGYQEMIVATKEMTAMLLDIVESHKQTFDPNQPARDYIDLFLRERVTREKKGDPQAPLFTDSSLVASLIQFYGDGSVSVGIFVAIYLQWLSKHIEVQEEIYEEVVRIVGTERLPSWEDRQNLPLTNSALKEILRTIDFAMIFPDFESIRNTNVMGFSVPKGTMTLINFYAIHKDPQAYHDPGTIDIRRYLPEKGKVEPPIMFGIGKRACVGESLVMTEIFLFVAAIIQNFIIEPEKKDVVEELVTFDMDVMLKAIPRSRGRYASLINSSTT